MRRPMSLAKGGLYGLALLLFMAALRFGIQADAGPVGWTVPGGSNALFPGDAYVQGNVVIGNGTPGVTQNGEDLYVEGTAEFDGAVTVDGNVTFNGTTNLGLDTFGTGIVFEGTTADAFETTLDVADPTTPDKTVTLPDATGTVMLTSLATNGADAADAVTGTTNGLLFEGASADDFEITLSPADPLADVTVTIPQADGTIMLTTLASNVPDAGNGVWGGTNRITFEGSTADAFETILTLTDPTADRVLTIPNGTGSVFLTSLATNVADAANAVTGTTNGFIFEGATADGFETTLVSTDVGADATITLPAATGTVARILGGASPAATCTVGEIFVDTDETVDTNCTTTADNSLCLCVATDTWAALENN